MRPSNDLPQVYLCRDAVDFRKGTNGLAVLIENIMEPDLFVLTVSAANLVPRAFQVRKWYKKKFPAYPSDHKVLIPYLRERRVVRAVV